MAAYACLAAERPDLRLVVVGEGPERTAAEGLPPELRERVLLLGALPNRDLPPIHAACDAFVAPNVGGESFGIVLVEAMAAGLPVVASAIPGFDEVIRDGVDGLLVPPGDLEALTRALGRVLDEPELAERLRRAGRERARAFSWEVVLPRLEAAYRRAGGRQGGRAER